MYKVINRFLLFCLPVTLLVIQNSCKKDTKYESQVLPQVSSVFPIAGIIGTEVEVKGRNLKDVAKVRFGTTDADNFNASANTDSTITVTVPAGLAPGELYVQVYYAETGYSSIMFTVLETPKPPTISTIDPGKAFPGTEITINGADFITVSEVKLGALKVDFTVTNTAIKFVVPENAVGGNQLITVTNPVGSVTADFTVDLSPVITSLNPGSGNIGDSIVITGVRLTDITSVKVGSIIAGFRAIDATHVKFRVPVGATPNNVTVTNAIGTGTSSTPFNVTGLDPILEAVTDPGLVFFDFNGTGKDRYWGDVGELQNSASLGLPGSGGYYRLSTTGTISGWNGFFWRNGGNNFPGAVIGTNVNDYVLKFDIYVIDPITGGEFAWRLKGTEGDFWYYWKPWAATGSFRTFGWKTFTIDLADFAEGAKHITDLSKIDSDFGVAFNNGTSSVNIAIDNVRFQHK